MNRKLYLVLASAAIILSVVACSFGNTSSNATNTPVVVNDLPSDALEILSTSTLTDTYGDYYVFGEVINNSDTPITGITLGIEITDASGASLITDMDGNVMANDTFSPMLYTIDSGESTPFSYYLGTTNTPPANYSVSVVDYSTGDTNRAALSGENIQIVEDGYGGYYLTGELVNTGDQWVHINGLAGGVLDDANTVLSADWTGTYATELAPAGDANGRDRTPFAVSFPMPEVEATQWSYWFDADYTSDVTDYDLGLKVTNSYFDEYGYVHLVGFIENYTSTDLVSMVVAGLYDADGLVLDASYQFLSAPIPAGGSVPFDVSYFGNVNYNSDQAALIDSYSVTFDTWNTYEPFSQSTEITYSGENIQKNGSNWTVTGSVNNSSTSNLANATVMVSVLDASDNLVAFGTAYLYPDGDAFAPGDSKAYEVYIYFSSSADVSGYHTVTTVVGDIVE